MAPLPKLPIPPLEETCERYIKVLEPLQTPKDHRRTKAVVEKFLRNEGPILHDRLIEYASNRASYIEEFWYESYLQHSDSVVLNLNPFFILEDDPTPCRGNQITRAASLILASIGFIHDLKTDQLEPDQFRGKILLDMYQYPKLFSTARIPTQDGCQMKTFPNSKHIVVMRRGQFYWFDVMDSCHRPVLTERDLFKNIQAIIEDADQTPTTKVAQSSIGLLTTERRPTWASIRQELLNDPNSRNNEYLEIVDSALFVVCLDGSSPRTADEICGTMLCGTYELDRQGVQIGTCLNRWYDKLQIIVCADGQAGINFEHSGVDGHTVLRFAGDVYTELILRFAKSINSNSRTLFKAQLSPWAHSNLRGKSLPSDQNPPPEEKIDTIPKKLVWELSNTLKASIRFAETRVSDLICQNEVLALEFEGYGKNFITSQNLSPDAFVQMAFQVCYFSLYGRIESTYEPAMTKSFSHGRTEGIRSVSNASLKFIKKFVSDVDDLEKILALKEACEYHQKISKECSQGLGQDRILFAMYSLAQQEVNVSGSSPSDDSISSDHENNPHRNHRNQTSKIKKIPKIFRDSGYGLLNHSTLSTSNCGNPALRLFGFGPVVSDGYGIGYIIKEDGLSFVISSKHLQTRRFLNRLQFYLIEIQKLLLEVNRPLTPIHVDRPILIKKTLPTQNQTGPALSSTHPDYNNLNPRAEDDTSLLKPTGNLQLAPIIHPQTAQNQKDNNNKPLNRNLLHRKITAFQEDEDALTSGYGFFDSGEIDRIISSTTQHSQRNSPRKFRNPIGTKLENINL